MNAVKENIKNSPLKQWHWTETQSWKIRLFCRSGEVFAAVLQKVMTECKTLEHLIRQKYPNGNSILHCLSKDPLHENQIDMVMFLLHQNGINPSAKNMNGKTFLDLAAIHAKLLQQIQTASDDWVQKFFHTCANKGEVRGHSIIT